MQLAPPLPHRTLGCAALLLVVLGGCRQSMRPDGPPPKTDPTAAYEALLREVVSPEGYVDYDKLAENREALDQYVAWLAGPRIWKRRGVGERHAPYLNAYNALTLYQVLERDQPDSVLDVRGLLPSRGSGFFVETQFKLGPDWLSLSEIAHERVRMAEMDPRSHAALGCAAMSCPPLRPQVYKYKADELQSQLRDQMAVWVADDRRGVRIERGEAVFNPIFSWHARDFEFWTAGQDLCTFTSKFAVGLKQVQLEELAAQGCPHRFFEFDWRLNSVENARQLEPLEGR